MASVPVYKVTLRDLFHHISISLLFHLARELVCLSDNWTSAACLPAPGVDSAMSGYDDNNGWGDDVGHGYHKSALRKDEVSIPAIFTYDEYDVMSVGQLNAMLSHVTFTGSM